MPDTEFEAAEKRLAAAYGKIEADKKAEKKPLTYTRFRALLSDTQNHGTIESYIEAHPDAEERTLSTLWDFREGIRFKKIRSISNLTQISFSEKYGIPHRSIQHWEQEKDTISKDKERASEYVYSSLLFAVLSDLSET